MLGLEKTINKVIINNHKIDLISKGENKQRFKEEKEDNSFNQLLSLQLLIQKHSGLKELCKLNLILL